MTDKVQLDTIKIEGILSSGTWSNPAGTTPLYVPVENARDLAGGFIETQAPKIANNPTDEMTNILTNYPLIDEAGLVGGAFHKNHAKGGATYYEPSNVAGGGLTTGPTAWTLNPDAPLMPGAGFKDLSGDFALAGIVEFNSQLYGLDVKHNRVLSFRSGVWSIWSGTAWRAVAAGGAGLLGTITAVADNGGGKYRCTSNAHGLSNGDKIVIASTNTTKTGLVGAWTVSGVTANTFDTTGTYDAAHSLGTVTWKCDAAQLTKAATEINEYGISGADSLILVGQGAAGDGSVARSSIDGVTWTDWGVLNAQHFAVVPKQTGGENIWYSSGRTVKSNAALTKQFTLGVTNTSVKQLLYFSNRLLVTKPEGAWLLDIDVGRAWRVIEVPDKLPTNGDCLILHNAEAWTSFQNTLRHTMNGMGWLKSELGMWSGTGARPFYTGAVIGAHSSGDKLWVVWRVVTSDAAPRYRYYIMAHRGGRYGDDWHTVFVSDATSDPTYMPAALYLYSGKLHFSIGNDVTGYLLTDGEVPMSDSTNTIAYAWNVGVWTGWVDLERINLNKHFKNLYLSTFDYGSALAVKLYYKKPTGSTVTLTNASTGTQDLLTVPINAESGAQAGFTASKVQFLLELDKDSDTYNGGYLNRAHVSARVSYPPARSFRLVATVETDGVIGPNREIAYQKTVDALFGAMSQAAPVKITWPDKTTTLGTLRGVTDRIQDLDRDGGVKKRSITMDFIEDN